MMYSWKILALILVLFLAASGCQGKRQMADDIYFEVVDSLLGSPIYLGDSGRTIRPPHGFESLPDTLMTRLHGILADSLEGNRRVKLLAYLWDDSTGASLIISQIARLNLEADTATFMAEYLGSLARQFGGPNIKSGDFVHSGLYFKNIIVTADKAVLMRLIALDAKKDALELFYTLPNESYPDLIKPVESSIGSLK